MIEAINDMVLLAVPVSQEEQSGGIVIPEAAQKLACERVVVHVGEKATAYGLKAGDVVIRNNMGIEEVSYDGKDYELVKEEEITAILNSN